MSKDTKPFFEKVNVFLPGDNFGVRLADGTWHSLLSYRVLDRGEHGGGEPTPFTGHYVEEVISSGPAISAWKFD